MKKIRHFGSLRRAAVLLALVATACAPMVPDLSQAEVVGAGPLAVTSAPTATAATTTPESPTTTVTTTTAPPTTFDSTTPSSSTTTSVAPEPESMTVGAWTATQDIRDESGQQFVASLMVPVLATEEADPAIQARVVTLVEGHVQSQVGATLALWRSIEGQGERDLTGSTLTLKYEIAAFEEELISIRFFSDEQVAGSGGVKRQVTTLMVDLQTGVAIGLDDVIVSGESRATLLALVADALLTEYFDGDVDAFTLWAGNLAVGDLNRALLTPDGLEFWFDELEVGPPDFGVPVVAIAYTELGDILDPAGAGSIFNSAAA